MSIGFNRKYMDRSTNLDEILKNLYFWVRSRWLQMHNYENRPLRSYKGRLIPVSTGNAWFGQKSENVKNFRYKF